MTTRRRTYSELIRYNTLEGRFNYLALNGRVAEETFGWERWVNQDFYNSTQWRRLRNHIIVRDNNCDLGLEGYDIPSGLHVHHMNPMSVDDIVHGNPDILDPEFLISCSHRTHNAIHYGDERLLPRQLVERRPGDTIPWRRQHV